MRRLKNSQDLFWLKHPFKIKKTDYVSWSLLKKTMFIAGFTILWLATIIICIIMIIVSLGVDNLSIFNKTFYALFFILCSYLLINGLFYRLWFMIKNFRNSQK